MGLNGREIIQKQMEMNQSFDLKTVYSKDKYAKRKESKWVGKKNKPAIKSIFLDKRFELGGSFISFFDVFRSPSIKNWSLTIFTCLFVFFLETFLP